MCDGGDGKRGGRVLGRKKEMRDEKELDMEIDKKRMDLVVDDVYGMVGRSRGF